MHYPSHWATKVATEITTQAMDEQEVASDSKSRIDALRRCHGRLVDLCTDWWLVEVLSWASAVIFMSITISMLASYDGKPLPERPPLGLSLNAYLSVLSALLKLALAIPLEEALGSQKYLWFSQAGLKRPLMDFERFDDAARGPLGALRLLLRTRTRYNQTIFAQTLLLTSHEVPSIHWRHIVHLSTSSGSVLSTACCSAISSIARKSKSNPQARSLRTHTIAARQWH